MLGNKRRRKSRGSESELLPSTPYAAVEKTKRKTKRKKKKTTKRLRRGEDGGGRGTERGRAVKKKSRDGEEKILGPVSSIFFFFLSNGILCSWMCRCHGNCNLVTSLFLPNPALKLWLLHPFAWLP